MRPEPRNVPGLTEALPRLETTLAQDDSSRNVMKVAEAFWLAGQTRRAVDLLEQRLTDDEEAIAPRVLLAWCYEDVGRAADARKIWSAVGGLDPANPYLRKENGIDSAAIEPIALRENEDLVEDRLTALEREAEPERRLSPEDVAALPPNELYSATMAEIFAEQGFEEKAIAIYEELLADKPGREDWVERVAVLRDRLDGGEDGK